jgi:hypothetical protein
MNLYSALLVLVSTQQFQQVMSEPTSTIHTTIRGRRRATHKQGKGGRKGSNKQADTPDPIVVYSGSNDDTHLEKICEILGEFDAVGRGSGNDSTIEWKNYCSDFGIKNHLLCPNEYELEKICSNGSSQLHSSAVELNYCEPLFEPLEDGEFQTACVEFCTNYVSMDLGSCCNLACP